MPVTDQHDEYRAALPDWQKCADFFGGARAVKAGGETYLPKPSGTWKQDDYQSYVLRAMFYPALARTVAGLKGAVVGRKPPDIEIPDRLRPMLQDITLSVVPMDALVHRLFEAMLVEGRIGLLVDFSEALQRPFLIPYHATDVINWDARATDAGSQLSLLVFREQAPDPTTEDRFTHGGIVQYRVLDLTTEGLEVTIWREIKNAPTADRFQIMETLHPTRRGERLREIPFTFFNPTSIDAGVQRPPLLDLVDVNESHYRTSADLELGRHFVALPTPWITGWNGDSGFQIGPSRAWTFENPQARVGMLEFTGAGLGALERALTHKESLMAILGARLLESQPTHVEAAATVRLRQAGDTTVLGMMASTLELGLTQALRRFAWWAGVDRAETEVHVTVNRDFFEETITPQSAETLMRLWQGKAISFETMFENMKAGELTRAGVSSADELAAIRAEPGPSSIGGLITS